MATFKFGLEVTEGHSNWYHLKAWVRFPIRLPSSIVTMTVYDIFGVNACDLKNWARVVQGH